MQPFTLAQRIQEEYRRYIATSFPIADDNLKKQIEQKVEEESLLWKGPYIALARPYKTETTLQDLANQGILTSQTVNIFSYLPALYTHQDKSIRKLCQDQHVLLSAGTGSGKTEAFLIPIIEHCIRNKQKPGTKALIVYPMNALANDQLQRLERYLKNTGITFGRYTGQTQETDAEKPTDIPKEEQWSRDAIRKNPPDILITNYAMLEYLLIRKIDQTIFRHKTLHYLVLDEIHTYTGARGTEVACLIRRLKEHTGLLQGGLICIGTSATLKKGLTETQKELDEAKQELAKFATNLFGEKFTTESIVTEEFEKLTPLKNPYFPKPPTITNEEVEKLSRQEPQELLEIAQKITGKNAPTANNPTESLFLLLQDNAFVRKIEELLEKPMPYDELANKIKELPERSETPIDKIRNEIAAYLILGSIAQQKGNPRLRPKLHVYFRGLWNFTRCLNPQCGALLTDGMDTCPHCGSRAFPLEICRSCGQDFMRTTLTKPTSIDTGDLQMGRRQIDILPYSDTESIALTLHLTTQLHKIEQETPEEELEPEEIPEQGATIWICQKCGNGTNEPDDGTCPREGCGGTLAKYLAWQGKITRCPACHGRYGTREVVTLLSTGTAAAVSTLTWAILSHIKQENERRLLIFSDNRQDTAYQAGYMRDRHSQFVWRQLIHQIVQQRDQQNQPHIPLDLLPEEVFDKAVQARLKRKPPTQEHRRREIDKLSWDILAEFTRPGLRRVNLEGLGLVAVQYAGLEETVNIPEFKELQQATNMKETELIGVFTLFLNEMRYRRALDHELLKRYIDQQTADHLGIQIPRYQRLPVGFGYAPSSIGKPYKIQSFANPKGAPTVFQQYFQKLTGLNSSDSAKLVALTVKILTESGHIVDTDIGAYGRDHTTAKMVNHQRVEAGPFKEGWQCSTCRRVFTVNTRDVCPTHRCTGTLHKFKPETSNFYVHLYHEMEPIRMEIKEHSGQIPPTDRQKFEKAFKEGEVNILVCTPTMELGVDIGELVTILLRNIPPSPSNYAQRAGRAGRRENQFALINTFARFGPHDSYFYAQPAEMILGEIHPPTFLLDNERIVKRHLHSLVLEKLHTELPRTLGGLLNDKEELVGFKALIEELTRRKAELADAISTTFQNDKEQGQLQWLTLGYINGLLLDFEEALREALQPWLIKRARLIKRLQQLPRYGLSPRQQKLSNSLNNLLWRISHDEYQAYTLSYLESAGFLPSYAFPGEQMELEDPNSLEPILRDQRIALEEYAPGNIVYVGGRKIKVVALNLREPTDTTSMESEPGKTYYRCPTCNHASLETTDLYCPHCTKEMTRHKFITPISMRGIRVGSITSEEEARARRGYDIWEFLLEEQAPRKEYNYEPLHLAYVRKGSLFFINAGPKESVTSEIPTQPFQICTSCGSWKDPNDENWEERHKKQCTGTTDFLHLGFRTDTDVLTIDVKPPSDVDENAYLATLRTALIAGALIMLEADEDEILGFDRTIFKKGGSKEQQIVLYETVPGGAGYLERVATNFPEIAKIAYELLSGCDCKTSCYKCLRTYYNQREHQILNRNIILPLLKDISQAQKAKESITTPTKQPAELEKEGERPQTQPKELVESPAEMKLLEAMEAFGLPQPEAQHVIIDQEGKVISRADFAYPKKRIAIFVDGYQYHSEPQRWQKDLEQTNMLISIGWKPLRFPAEKVLKDPENCVRRIRQLLEEQ